MGGGGLADVRISVMYSEIESASGEVLQVSDQSLSGSVLDTMAPTPTSMRKSAAFLLGGIETSWELKYLKMLLPWWPTSPK